MVGAAYAAVPLYSCSARPPATAAPRRSPTGNPKGIIAREMTVRFDSNVDGDLAWTRHAGQAGDRPDRHRRDRQLRRHQSHRTRP